jgi:hypothetical protein
MLKALEYINKLIDLGYDYADAQYKASKKFKVNASKLQQYYDAQY